jgi:methionine synthase II (cobalamin-independent)
MKTIYSTAQDTFFPITVGSYPASSVAKAIEIQARYGVHFPSTGEVYVAKLHNMALPILEAFNGVRIQENEILVDKLPTLKEVDELRQLGIITEIRQASDKIKKLLDSEKYPAYRGLKVSISGPGTLIHSVYNDTSIPDVELLKSFASGIEGLVEHAVEAGAEVIQIDEPFLARSNKNRTDIISALDNMFQQLKLRFGNKTKYIALHACHKHDESLHQSISDMSFDVIDMEFMEFPDEHFSIVQNEKLQSKGKNIGIGVVSGNEFVESDQSITNQIYRIVKEYDPHIVILKPDCALRHLDMGIAENKLKQIQFARKTALTMLGIVE